MKFREQPEYPSGWFETMIQVTLRSFGKRPAVDENRVTAAMRHGWRYQEPPLGERIPDEDYIGALQTSAWFTLDAETLFGALQGIVPEHEHLPPLPFPRIALDAIDDDGKPAPLVTCPLTESLAAEQYGVVVARTLVIFEIEQGALWDVLVDVVTLSDDGEIFARNVMGYHFTPGGFTADYEGMRLAAVARGDDPATVDALEEFDGSFSRIAWDTCVTALHLITASNVTNLRVHPHRKQRRDMQRQRFQPVEPRIYRVDVGAAGNETNGKSDRQYHVRWMVTGHYRHWPTGKKIHPDTGLPALWVPGYVKGPAGAPWKGRPVHVVGKPT